MGKLKESVAAVRTFFDEVAGEVRKSSWPGRQELIESTVVVIFSVVILGLFVGVCDKVLLSFLELLIPTSR